VIRFVALLLTVLTGFSGLVYEVAWQKYLATLVGADSEATAAVLAIFLGGLASGYALFGVLTRRRVEGSRAARPQLLRFYGLVEAGIGAYALTFPTLFGVVQSVSFLVPAGHEAASFAFDLFLTVILLLPPTVLMGGTIPVLTQALAENVEEATRVHAWVYGFNTAGAFAGALAGGFVLVPWLGLDGVLYAMGCVNLAVGTLFVALGLFQGKSAPAAATVGSAQESAPVPLASYGIVALLAGFAMMCLQTVIIRVSGLAFGASHFTFATVVAVFVLCIALGSFAVSALSRVPPLLFVGSQWALVALLGALYFGMEQVPYWAYALRAVFRDIPENFYPYYLAAFLGLLAVLAVPIGISGALLPLMFHHLRREYGNLGGVAGRLYSWNTVGSLTGAVLGGYALLFWLDLHDIYRIAVAALAVGAAILTVRVLRVGWAAAGLVAVVTIAVLFQFYRPWAPQRLAVGLFRTRSPTPYTFAGPAAFYKHDPRRPIFYRDDPTTTVSVEEQKWPGGTISHVIFTNAKPDGDTIGDNPTMAMMALVPALLADRLDRSFVIGFGTGVTVGQLGALEGTREVVVAEISSGVVQAAPIFDYANHQALKNPKIRIVRSDAYRSLLRSEGKFDVIISEPSNPWVMGVEMLFSQEFLRAARDHLAQGGVYAQWFHLYENDPATVDLVLRTYSSVFDHVSVWYTEQTDVLLLGFQSPEHALDVERIRQRFDRPDFKEGFARAGIRSVAALLSHEVLPLDTLAAAALVGPVHTLRHPILSDWAARAFFVGATAELPRLASGASAEVGVRNSLLRRLSGLDDRPVPEELLFTLAKESSRLGDAIVCADVMARAVRDHSDSDRLRNLRQQLLETGGQWTKLLGEKELTALVELYGGEAKHTAAGAANATQVAKQLTDQFVRFFYHAIPFDRQVVERAWERCSKSDATGVCNVGRAQAGKLLGFDRPSPSRP
jgi:spermidine synthase